MRPIQPPREDFRRQSAAGQSAVYVEGQQSAGQGLGVQRRRCAGQFADDHRDALGPKRPVKGKVIVQRIARQPAPLMPICQQGLTCCGDLRGILRIDQPGMSNAVADVHRTAMARRDNRQAEPGGLDQG